MIAFCFIQMPKSMPTAIDPQRRRLLTAGLALGLSGCAARAPFDPFLDLPSLPVAEVFTCGVASGAPQEDAVVLWTQLSRAAVQAAGFEAAEIPVGWELAQDAQFARALRSGIALARAADDYSVHLRVDGLAAHQRYWYRFRSLGAVSATGQTCTTPALWAAVASLKLVVVSGEQNPATWRVITENPPDLLLQLGSGMDADGARDLADYRARYAKRLADADLQAARAACAWLTVVGDAEIARGYAGPFDRHGSDKTRFLQRRAAAYQALFEHLPWAAAQRPQGAQMRLHQRLHWGRLLALHLLDGRQYRDRPDCPALAETSADFACAPVVARAREPGLLGRAQEDWLLQGVSQRAAQWNLIAQIQALLPGAGGGDGWDAFGAQRQRLLQQLLRAQVTDSLWVCQSLGGFAAAPLRLQSQARAQAMEWRAPQAQADEAAPSGGFFELTFTPQSLLVDAIQVLPGGARQVLAREHIRAPGLQRLPLHGALPV
ncbi:alkaline phosphatase [Sinimarinibacterium sp. NLF-5-8]|uniref:alkaline phosphatase D family protein n=1 Tax=Sinimarinibacterium sp. NLF-5-8 TaxID=2698684 RepID=UPI00137BD150|nr:alkaline phosphatase D family protein [Sinimarinibacterium sp. NLF-5-8]QHS10942.1 hypothetical protein GT972_12830 [Sinimarinibacterium sp. NLF-5-8]